MKKAYCKITSEWEPAVVQNEVNGHAMTWNPDDARFYVHANSNPGSDVQATFKEWRNAVQYARKKPSF